MSVPPSTYALAAVADDLEWLQHSWAAHPDKLSDGDVRRGGATLRRLLLERGQGAIMAAWRIWGLEDQPEVIGPDLLALLAQLEKPLELTVTAVAGGAPISGITYAAMGLHRVDHPDGTPAAADEGFAVSIEAIAALKPTEGTTRPPSVFYDNVHRRWRLRDYIEAPGGVRRGRPISRQSIIQFFCKDAGAVHLDQLFGAARSRTEGEQLAAELDSKVFTDWRNGLAYEILAIGYALGSSPDLAKLATLIRERL